MSTWTVQLTEVECIHPCAGRKGKVVASVTPEAGLALLHRHGDGCLLHEGRPVTAGTKYVLRSDIIFGPVAA